MYRSPIAVALVVILASASIPTTIAADPPAAQSTSFPMNVLRPILVGVLGETTTQQIETNFGNVIQAVGTGNPTKILSALLAIVDPNNVVQNGLSVFNTYQNQMWTPEFRDEIAGIIRGATKAFSSGIDCWSKNLQDNLANFTTAYVTALQNSFAANTPNKTAPAQNSSPLTSAPTAVLNSARLFIDMLFAPELREAVIAGARGLVNGYTEAYTCARSNTTDLMKSWNALTSQLTAGSADAKATVPVTEKPSSGGGFLGLF